MVRTIKSIAFSLGGRWKRIFFIVVVVGCSFFFGGAHFIAPRILLQPQRSVPSSLSYPQNLSTKEITIEGMDGISLKGSLVFNQEDSIRGFIVFLHGIGGNRNQFSHLLQPLTDQNIAALLIDGRAHGISDGKYCTYGYKEKKDVTKMIDFIHAQWPKSVIGIWGFSMGGAIALQALEEEERLAFGIVESSFCSLKQVVFDYKKRYFGGWGSRHLSDYFVERAGRLGQFNPDEVSPIALAKSIRKPVLLAHGKADNRIHFSNGEQIFEKLASKEKVFVPIDGAGHFNLWEKGGLAYQKQLFDFINLYLPKK